METQRLLPGGGGGGKCLLANLDRHFFCKNGILKQKRTTGSERVNRNVK
jgi:hypothetical protein